MNKLMRKIVDTFFVIVILVFIVIITFKFMKGLYIGDEELILLSTCIIAILTCDSIMISLLLSYVTCTWTDKKKRSNKDERNKDK